MLKNRKHLSTPDSKADIILLLIKHGRNSVPRETASTELYDYTNTSERSCNFKIMFDLSVGL